MTEAARRKRTVKERLKAIRVRGGQKMNTSKSKELI